MRSLRRSRHDPLDDERDEPGWSAEEPSEDPHPAGDPYGEAGTHEDRHGDDGAAPPDDRVGRGGVSGNAHASRVGQHGALVRSADGSTGSALLDRRASIRLRTGVGAAVVLVGAALVITILVTAIQAAGAGGTTASPAAPASSTAHPDGDPAAAGADDGDSADGAGSTAARPTATTTDDAAGSAGATGTGSTASGAAQPIYVHVVGAVVAPGLFPLVPGSRVVDALAAAHGFADGADPAGVNLARVLSDGEQLVVPRQGEAATGAGAAGSGAAESTGAAGGAATPGAPVDLNTATAEQLETLPRVGPSLAGRIIAWRTAHGRFAHVADLGRVPGIGDRTLASLTPLVRV